MLTMTVLEMSVKCYHHPLFIVTLMEMEMLMSYGVILILVPMQFGS